MFKNESMHWLFPFCCMEAKFWPWQKKIDVNRDAIFQKDSWVHPFWPQKEWRTFGRVDSRISWQKLRRYRSNWLQHVTRMNNRMPKIMLKLDQMETMTWKTFEEMIRWDWNRSIKASLMTDEDDASSNNACCTYFHSSTVLNQINFTLNQALFNNLMKLKHQLWTTCLTCIKVTPWLHGINFGILIIQ
jgi:hypothetical protein